MDCDKTKERSVQIFIPYERSFSLVFCEEEWLVWATPSTWNFGSTSPHCSKIADFEPIFARSAAAVALFLLLQCCAKRKIEYDAPISRFYERLAAIQARGSQPSHQVLREILKDVQTNMVPRGLLKEWAMHTFPTASDYWTFRKNVINAILAFSLEMHQ